MKVLVVGSGGREHAIIWKLRKDNENLDIYCASGNGGIEEIAECIDISPTDIDGLLNFAKGNNIDFTIVGMDDPLALGIVDIFEKEGLKIFGPRKNAAIIEASKSFSKEFMKRNNIPTGGFEIFNDPDLAKDYIREKEFPLVIKADGLAYGKGVIICETLEEGLLAIDEIMVDKVFNEAGNEIVIEDFLVGEEVSVLCFCDGKTIKPMPEAADHKKVYDGDKGLNTGGMGVYSPCPVYTDEIKAFCEENVYEPTIKAMKKEDREFKGILFVGLILTKDGPKVLEYNARFGDPETQGVLPNLKTNLLDILIACEEGKLDEIDIKWEDNSVVVVIASSGGYPSEYRTGYEITGLDTLRDKEDILVFHAGTKKTDNTYLTNGGRVLGVCGIDKDRSKAKDKAYQGISSINFENMHYRKDIGEIHD